MSVLEEIEGPKGSKHREMVLVAGGTLVLGLLFVLMRRHARSAPAADPAPVDAWSGASTQDPYGGVGGGVLGQTDSNATQFGQWQGVIDGLAGLTAQEAATTAALGKLGKGNVGVPGKGPIPKPKPKPQPHPTIPVAHKPTRTMLPVKPRTVIVKRGDTLSAIAKQNHTTVAQLAKVNHIQNPNLIHPGQVFKV